MDIITIAFNNNYHTRADARAVGSSADWLVFVREGAQLLTAQQDISSFLSACDADTAVVEFRQQPQESNLHYHPYTLEKTTFDCRSFAIRREVFTAIGGFDPLMPVTPQADDLARRVLASGKKIKYAPDICVNMPPYTDERQLYINTKYARLMAAYKYGDKGAVKWARDSFYATLQNPRHFDGIRKRLAVLWAKSVLDGGKISAYKKKNPDSSRVLAQYSRVIGTPVRGISLAQQPVEDQPFVSVVVRTHQRKDVLRQTLASLRHQTYKNFEIVVLEDGRPTAQQMIAEEFADMNIRYHATGENVGRGRAGNLGIEQAKADLVCLLDDDDYFYADALESFVSHFTAHPDTDMAISGGMAFEADVHSTSPYIYEERAVYPMVFDHVNLMDMCVKCRLMSSSVMFRKQLYYDCGGMREDIGGDEDWAMWLRFMSKARRLDKFHADIPRALCYFGVPADKEAAQKREEAYAVFDKIMLSDENLKFTVSTDEIHQWEETVKADVLHLVNLGRAGQFARGLKPIAVEKLEYTDGEAITLTAKQINGYYHYLVSQLTGIELKEI